MSTGTNQERITQNNTKLDDITAIANTLPDLIDGTTLNVFTQLTEPTIKKGIWLQMDAEMEHFVSDDDIFVGGVFDAMRNIPMRPLSDS